MVTTHDQVETERQGAVRSIHDLLREKERVRGNVIMNPRIKAGKFKSIDEELARAQDHLDKTPPDPPAAG